MGKGRETARRLGREQLGKHRSFSRASRANFAASPLVRPARQNRHATQATHCLTTTLSFDIRCVGNKIHIVKSCTLRRVRKMIVRETQSTKPIFIMILIFKIFASASKLFPGGYRSPFLCPSLARSREAPFARPNRRACSQANHQPVRDVSHLWTGQGSNELSH